MDVDPMPEEDLKIAEGLMMASRVGLGVDAPKKT
jgi:hypothetical protein